MALILPTHRRSREAIVAAGGTIDPRKLHVAVEVKLDRETVDYLTKVVPQCVVGTAEAKVTKVEEEVVDLESMSKAELAKLGAEKGVKVGLTMKKGAIIEAILSSDAALAADE